MPKIVACMRGCDFINGKIQTGMDCVSEELIQAIFYSYVKYQEAALKELPKSPGAVIAGPQGLKEFFAFLKSAIGAIAQEAGERAVLGLSIGLSKVIQDKMPYGIGKLLKASEMIPDGGSLTDLPMDSVFRGDHGLLRLKPRLQQREEIDSDSDEEKKTGKKKVVEELQNALVLLEKDSYHARQISIYERFLWQTQSLQKRISLFAFHLISVCWNTCEAEKARHQDGWVKALLWLGGAVISVVELRKSASFSNITSFYCYTPERFGLTMLKVCFITIFLFQCCFVSSFKEIDHVQKCNLILEKLFISVVISTLTTMIALSALKRGYEKKIDIEKKAIDQKKEILLFRLSMAKAIADKP